MPEEFDLSDNPLAISNYGNPILANEVRMYIERLGIL